MLELDIKDAAHFVLLLVKRLLLEVACSLKLRILLLQFLVSLLQELFMVLQRLIMTLLSLLHYSSNTWVIIIYK